VGDIGGSDIQQLFADTVIQFEDGLIINHGQHIFHTGFQYWRQRVNTFYSGNSGTAGFMRFTGGDSRA
jgi:hypothetical protein